MILYHLGIRLCMCHCGGMHVPGATRLGSRSMAHKGIDVLFDVAVHRMHRPAW